jgi:GST-like protein
MPLTLFGSPGSGSAAVEMALRAAQIEYRVERASEWEPDSAVAELRNINPLGQIPTLIFEDGTILTESAAILVHLGLEYPGHSLLPEASAERASALRGLVFIAANCYTAVSISDYPERWTTSKTKAARERVRVAARAQLHRNWEIFFEQFTTDLERAKGNPGALAFLAVVVSRWSGTRKHLLANNDRATKLLAALEKHSRIAGVLHEHSAA